MGVNPVDVGFAALVLPPVVALINQHRWPPQVKALVALLVCLLYAAGAEWMRGQLDLGNWRDTLIVTAGSAFAAYRLWWHPSGIAPAIEAATSTDAPPAGPSRTQQLG